MIENIKNLTVEIAESSPHKYSPRVYINGLSPTRPNGGEPVPMAAIHWTAGYHTPEQDAEFRAEAIGLANLFAASLDMLAALKSAEIAVEQLCHGQDPANECWVTLAAIRTAITKAGGSLT